MRIRVIAIVILTLLLSACSTKTMSDNDSTQASTPPEPTSEPTPTQIPLSELDLEGIIVMEGDLPAGYSGAQIRDTAPAMFEDLPVAQKTIYQQLAKGNDSAGGVTVFLFESDNDLARAYEEVLAGLTDGAVKLEGVGDKGKLDFVSMKVLGDTIQFGDLVFTRCNALAHLRMTQAQDKEYLISYAKRLDKRLAELICP